jgi:hypothetical protein
MLYLPARIFPLLYNDMPCEEAGVRYRDGGGGGGGGSKEGGLFSLKRLRNDLAKPPKGDGE